ADHDRRTHHGQRTSCGPTHGAPPGAPWPASAAVDRYLSFLGHLSHITCRITLGGALGPHWAHIDVGLTPGTAMTGTLRVMHAQEGWSRQPPSNCGWSTRGAVYRETASSLAASPQLGVHALSDPANGLPFSHGCATVASEARQDVSSCG